MPSSTSRPVSGFTLVELSIVLVVIGLLLGGVIIGKDMIRSAQLRSVITEVQGYLAASQMFQDKYNCLPGDCVNVTTYMSGVTNGNGDGRLNSASGANAAGEIFGAWQQLAKSGYIPGTFTGLSGPTNGYNAIIGTNVPASRFPLGGYDWRYQVFSGGTQNYDGNYGNSINFGGKIANDTTLAPILTPSDAYGIDQKMDDGVPSLGIVRAFAGGTALPNNCSTGTSGSGASASYNLGYTGISCSLIFITGW